MSSAPDTPTGRPRRTQEQRRKEAERRLLDAAAALIAEHGTAGMTLPRIGERAGYSRGMVTHHFGSKAALVERLAMSLQEHFHDHAEPTVRGLDGLEALRSFTAAYIRDVRNDPGAQAFFVLWAEAATTAPQYLPQMVNTNRRVRGWLTDWVRTGIATGTIHHDLDASAFVAAHLAMLRGIVLEHLADPEGIDLDAIRTQALANLDHLRSPRDPDVASKG